MIGRVFSSVFGPKIIDNLPAFPRRGPTEMQPVEITPAGIYKQLSSIDYRKANGPDEVSSRFLKVFAAEITPFITAIFRKSLAMTELPDVWKKSIVSPIFKSGARTNPENYRPISLTCTLCKIYEHIIVSALMKYLDENSLLTQHQHGFRKRRSCEGQLISVLHDIASSAERGGSVDAVFLDLRKAFDTVDHRRLLLKLRNYGTDRLVCNWIEEYLRGRSMRVSVDGDLSAPFDVTSGVPQGSVIGPVLFLIYINDMVDVVDSSLRLFADDALLFAELKTEEDQIRFQRDLNALTAWADTWGMGFNIAKCAHMRIAFTPEKRTLQRRFTMRNQVLQTVQKYRYLGITISHDLKWEEHIKVITGKAKQLLGLLRRNLSKATPAAKKVAYCALVRSQLEYGAAAWDPYYKKDIDELESVQRKAGRFIYNKYGPAHVSDLLKRAELAPLAVRRKDHRIDVLHKIVTSKLECPGAPVLPFTPREQRNSTLRAKNQFFIRTHRDIYEMNDEDPRKHTLRDAIIARVERTTLGDEQGDDAIRAWVRALIRSDQI